MAESSVEKTPVELIPALLPDLYDGIMGYITVRVGRLWETIYPNSANVNVTTTDLLLIDGKGNSMHGIIPKDVKGCYKQDIIDGAIYKILHFQVKPSKSNYKIVPSNNEILFNSNTEFERLSDKDDKYPKYHFNFATFDQIKARNEHSPLLTDFAGLLLRVTEVSAIRKKETGEIVDKMDAYIRLLSGDELRVTLWKHHIQKLDTDYVLGLERKPVIVFLATIVKDYSDNKNLSSSSATTVYIDPDIEETTQIKTIFSWDTTPVQLIRAGQGDALQALTVAEETVIARLNYMKLSEIRGKKFKVKAQSHSC